MCAQTPENTGNDTLTNQPLNIQDTRTIVVSASKRRQKIEEVPVSMEVIRPQLIDHKGITDLEQAVDQTPGVYSSIDNFAEKIRSLGTYVPASYSRFDMLSKIEDETQILPKDAMVKELLMDNARILTILKYTYDAAEDAGEHGFSNFLAERMDAHRKHGWMLRASIKGQPQ